jgi:tetratricopeptide (TPR) repeat protein
MNQQPDFSLQRLAAEMVGYDSGRFLLSADLEGLARVRKAAAPEAIVFYCARILEALAADALRNVKLEPSPNVFSNLDALQQYNLIHIPTLYWAHSLRRSGNTVRHIHRRLNPKEPELALLFTERWLQWFFQDYRHGMKLECLTSDGQPLGLSSQARLRTLLANLEKLDQHVDDLLAPGESGMENELLWDPALPAVLAEMLLERSKNAEARRVLALSLERFPDDLRLNQLLGLYYSRMGDFDKAECLEPLLKKHADDDETAGITAGVYKRRWMKDRTCKNWLEKSQRTYRQGWKQSKKGCAYLGINAASTALWLGRPEEARQLAGEVRKHLHDRRAAILRDQETSDRDVSLNYWDQATLAEAELLLGNFAEARRIYNQAFAMYDKEQPANTAVTRQQLETLLPFVGYSGTVAEFLKPA